MSRKHFKQSRNYSNHSYSTSATLLPPLLSFDVALYYNYCGNSILTICCFIICPASILNKAETTVTIPIPPRPPCSRPFCHLMLLSIITIAVTPSLLFVALSYVPQ